MNHEEDHIVDALCNIAKQMDIKCVIQIGAQDGYECLAVCKATGARGIAIEGNSECVPCSPELEWHRLVIGDANRQTIFYVHPDPALSGLLPRGHKDERAITVKQQSLDTFCEENSLGPDMLIVDTEGTTLEVLDGADNILDSVRLIYAECQTKEIRPGVSLLYKVDAFLTDRGFRQHQGLPSYEVEVQGNYTWVK
ncbi:MAG TPA: FkbM family methyltransferase [Nitrososphaera sp.]|nr:FkbM family methyltransferase [Nitrososphaera sp.]